MNQILEIVKIMQQERSGALLVLLSIDTDIPSVDFRFLSFLVIVLAFLCLFFICFSFALFVCFTFYSYLFFFL